MDILDTPVGITIDPRDTPRRRADLLTVELGPGVFVLDQRRVRAHGLNATAAAVLGACDGTRDVAEVTASVATGWSTAPADIAEDVVDVLGHLAAELLITLGTRDDPPQSVPPRNRFASVPHTEVPVDADVAAGAAHATARFRGLDFTFEFRTDDAEFATWLDGVLRPLRTDGPGVGDDHEDSGQVHTYLALTDAPGLGHLLALDGFECERPANDAALAAAAIWHANQMVSVSSTRWLQLHASAAVIDGVAVVASAVMNSGKSTLVAGLVEAGAGYLTDETVAVEPDAFAALAYPKAIALDPGSFSVLPHLEPPGHDRAGRWEHAKWYVDPDRVRPGATAPGAPIGLVVLPHYRAGAPTEATRVDPLRAAVALAGNCFNLVELGESGLATLTRLADTVPVYDLQVGDLASAVATVFDLVAGLSLEAPPG